MIKARVSIAWDNVRGWHVDLPSARQVEGTYLPIVEGVINAHGVLCRQVAQVGEEEGELAEHDAASAAALIAKYKPTVLVEVPNHTPFTRPGQIDRKALQAMYHESPRHGHRRKDWRAPKVHGELERELDPRAELVADGELVITRDGAADAASS